MGNRLYVGNLAFDTTDARLSEVFSEFGEVTESKIILDRESGRSRGFGFVVMATNEQAQKAIAQMNGRVLDGRQLRVNEAEERQPRGGGGFGGGRGGGGFGGGGGGGGRKSGGGSRRGNRSDRW
jgi:RNA recognition motif-containing protein